VAISEKVIISPEPSKPSVPLKKSTLAVLSVVVLVAGFVSSILMKGDQPSAVAQAQAKQIEKEPTIVGTARAVDDEEESARKKIADEEVARRKSAHSTNQEQSDQQTGQRGFDGDAKKPQTAAQAQAYRQSGGPDIPQQYARKDNTAAMYESGRSNSGAAQTRESTNAQNSRGSKELEYEAQSRNSKALISDFTSDSDSRLEKKSATSGSTLSATSNIDSYEKQIAAQSQAQAQNDAYKPAIAAVMDAMKGNQSANESSKTWLKEYSAGAGETGSRKNLTSYKTQSRSILHQGSVIPAILTRQINSDLPGEITASTTIDVYDSMGLRQLLIPKGSKLIGSYDSEVKAGQARLLFAFKRLIMPSGESFDLPAARGSDVAGAAGLQGDVDTHFFKKFASSFFIAVLADKTKQPASVTNIGGSSGGVNTAAGQVLVDVSKSILERNKTIQPTITVDQGTRINIEVVADMLFSDAVLHR